MTTSKRPLPFSEFTTPDMWNDPHISEQMLVNHLDPDSALASRSHDFIDLSAQWLMQVLELKPGSRLLDLGCGPGLYANRLAHKGVEITGIDVSTRSLAHARKVAEAENLSPNFIEGSYLNTDMGSNFDAAILIYEDYCALSPSQRVQLLQRINRALVEGGYFLFDVTSTSRFNNFSEGIHGEDNLMNGFWSPLSYYGTMETWIYPDLRLALEKFTITTANKTSQYFNWTHCLSVDQVKEELSNANLEMKNLFGDISGSTYDPTSSTFAVLSSKKIRNT